TTTRSGKLSGTVTATVLEVMANGNLLLEGTRSIRVNRETQIMRVRGVARPRDIDASNSVNSKMLADAQIKFDGNGAVGRVNRPGLITRFMNVVF
ncbi:MAG: flagellar L-ring protein FlgH, partial [Clostridiales bacterium]|nr:flagellar L-ring protein FlgH [Clostridiales bacterium]MDN5283196.1 flagellar L-ring protein FlgH [Candidatus Ozemobacter sp.]